MLPFNRYLRSIRIDLWFDVVAIEICFDQTAWRRVGPVEIWPFSDPLSFLLIEFFFSLNFCATFFDVRCSTKVQEDLLQTNFEVKIISAPFS